MAEQDESKQPAFTYIRDAHFRSVYCNNTNFTSTAFDFNMTFCEIMKVDPTGEHVEAEERVKVVMSPLHFKIFAVVCAQNLKNYEDRFGAIALPGGGSGGVVVPGAPSQPETQPTEAEPSV